MRNVRSLARLLPRLRGLPWRVRWFFLRAWVHATRSGDDFSQRSVTRPQQLALLLRLAAERRRTVELGTGTAWTAIALALADSRRTVVTYDPLVWPERDRYLAMIPASARERIELRTDPGDSGPAEGDPPADLVFVDSSHEREDTVASFRAWSPALSPGGAIVFHDYGHPDYPGVQEAIEELGLHGEAAEGMFIWRR